jgi:hypothetical protein
MKALVSIGSLVRGGTKADRIKGASKKRRGRP